MSVRDLNNKKYFWLKEESEFIKNAIENKISIISVCLGAQLLAHTLGGKIEQVKDEFKQGNKPELGWFEISSIDKKSYEEISIRIKEPLKVLHWHWDGIILSPQLK